MKLYKIKNNLVNYENNILENLTGIQILKDKLQLNIIKNKMQGSTIKMEKL